MFNRLPALARFLFALIAIDLVVFAAFRGAFWAAFHEALANASSGDLLKALYLGFKFDLRLPRLLCLSPPLSCRSPPFGPRPAPPRPSGSGSALAPRHSVLRGAYCVALCPYYYLHDR